MTPYAIPPLSPLRAQLVNAVSVRPLPWSFPVGAGACSLDLAPDAAPAPFACACAVHIRAGGGLWRAELGSLAPLLLHPDVAEAGGAALLPDLPDALILAVLEHLFGPLLDRASAWLGVTAEFADAPADAPEWAGWLDMRLGLPASGALAPSSVPLRLYYPDASSVRCVLERLGDLPRRRRDVSAAPVPCFVEAGRARLRVAEVRDLEPGDVVLPEVWNPEAPRLRLPDGTAFVCRAAPEGVGRVEIVGPDVSANSAPPQEVSMSAVTPHDSEAASESSPAASAADPAAPAMSSAGDAPLSVDVDGLELTVSFELERLTLTVGELASLAAGYTFALACDPASPVTLRAGGQALAEGRLVDLNGVPGVQLTRVLAGAASAAPMTGPAADAAFPPDAE